MFQAHNKYLTRLLLSPDVKSVSTALLCTHLGLLNEFLARFLATCSADTTIKIWSITPNYEFKLEKTLQGHQRWVWDCAFSADSAYLVTGTYTFGPSSRCTLIQIACQPPRTTLRDYGTCRPERPYDNTTDIRRVSNFAWCHRTRAHARPSQRPCVAHCTMGPVSFFAPRIPRVQYHTATLLGRRRRACIL